MKQNYRRTKIIFTVGPATASEENLEKVIRAGADICRLNMAHANHDWTREIVERLRNVCKRIDKWVPAMMDVKGPEIRTGPVEQDLELEAGETFDLLVKGDLTNLEPDIRGVTVNYPRLNEDVKVGSLLLIDSGLVRMEVLEALDDRLRCRVVIPGPLTSRRHINLPGTHVRLPALTDKDRGDIEVGLDLDVEMFALSFVRQAEDVEELRNHLRVRGSRARIIAKIEDQSGIANLESIIKASNGIMVARGDLGVECPYESLPLIQRRAIRASIEAKKPCIVATHMLESMISQPIPTRAEVTDIANAVFEQADAIMLSGETSVGKYPDECVGVMRRIALTIEAEETHGKIEKGRLATPKSKMLRSAAILSQELGAGLIVFTRTGFLPEMLSALRPSHCPIFAFTDNHRLYRQMPLMWGVYPIFMQFGEDSEETIRKAFYFLRENLENIKVVEGDWMVVITNVLGTQRVVDSIQMRTVE